MRAGLLLLLACAAATPRVPDEVTRFAERWQMCWHFSGEEPYDDARAKQIADGQAEYCPGNDGERARLTAKYRGNAPAQDALKKLDEMK